MIKLGDKVKDKITGFTGIVISRIEYLAGCTQYGVKPPVDKDGKMIHVEYIDEAHLEVVSQKKEEKKVAEKEVVTGTSVVGRRSPGGISSDMPSGAQSDPLPEE